MISIFPDKSLKQKLETFDLGDIRKKREIILNWQKAIKNGSVLKTKEEALQANFLNNFFGEVLNYEYNLGKPTLNLVIEKKTETDSTKSDGALGFFEDGKRITKVVIELKDAKTDLDKPQNRKNDRRSPVEQAFSYASKSGGQCKWVIVSNFLEIRLYHSSDQGKYEVFNILDLLNLYELKRFFFLLQKDRLIAENTDSEIDLLYAKRQAHEKTIEYEFYEKFKRIRWELFQHLQSYNQAIEEHILFEKTQKLLDRFIFVFFCEDLMPALLPSDTSRKILNAYENRGFDPSDDILWRHSKGLFQYINNGEPRADINKFNGGLFAFDEILDNLIIKDKFLINVIQIGEDYDFDSDLNVNVLGHIFEQSISDIEEIKAEIAGEVYEKNKGKQKKDGIFYTPPYITKYIIEQTVGKWLEDKKQELNFNELPKLHDSLLDPEAEIKDLTKTQKAQLVKAQKEHLEFWLAYKEKLSNIKIIDPACGSGAFLNQAFDYLQDEHERVDRSIASSRGGATYFILDSDHQSKGEDIVIANLNNHILQNNLFGVDLNEESVEITKLSLWLKTANKSSELTSLDNNIKCGNSLIDDPSVAGKKAFNWNEEFGEVFDRGGFDIIIGNPPYVFAREKITEAEKNFYIKSYESAEYQINTFVLFIEKALKLTKDNGFIGQIVPNSLLKISSICKLRKYLLDNGCINNIVQLHGESFENVGVETVILCFEKTKTERNLVKVLNVFKPDDIINQEYLFIDSSSWQDDPDCRFQISTNSSDDLLLEKIKLKTKPLKELFDVKTALKAYQSGKGKPKQTPEDVKNRPFDFKYKFDENTFAYLEGNDVKRWNITWSGTYLKYGKHLAEPRNIDIFEKPRILIREITSKFPKSLTCTFVKETYLNNLSIVNILSKSNDEN